MIFLSFCTVPPQRYTVESGWKNVLVGGYNFSEANRQFFPLGDLVIQLTWVIAYPSWLKNCVKKFLHRQKVGVLGEFISTESRAFPWTEETHHKYLFSLFFRLTQFFKGNGYTKTIWRWMKKGVCKTIRTNTGRQRIHLSGALDINKHRVLMQEDTTPYAESTQELSIFWQCVLLWKSIGSRLLKIL